MTRHIGMVHTVAALAERFDREVRAAAGEPVRITHVVAGDLLDRAIRSGVDENTLDELHAHVLHLASLGADPILVTCSSIGEATDEVAAEVEATVVRVDRAMAEVAAELVASATGNQGVAVLATLEATLGPTGRLLADELARRDLHVPLAAELVQGAAEARGRGDQEQHDRLIASAIESAAAAGNGVVVLAQASMATAVAYADAPGLTVLTSPPSAVRATIEAAGLGTGVR